MEQDWLEDKIDELAILEKRASERLSRFEDQFKALVSFNKGYEDRLLALAEKQTSTLFKLEQQLTTVHQVERRLWTVGAWLVGIALVCLLVSGGMYWRSRVDAAHADVTWGAFEHQLKWRDSKAYVRIVPGSVTTPFMDDHQRTYSGHYAQLYLR